ncbi:MAG: leucine-rich repeat protein [Clostridia bacterium]|nr:leucine-rich repeat protein [Clostridia bacterium]
MKKKLLLTLLMTLTLVFALAAFVNAAGSDYDSTYTLNGKSYNLWELGEDGNYHPLTWYLNSDKEMCSVWTDGQVNASGTYMSLGCYENQLTKMTVYEADGEKYTSDTSFVIVNFTGVGLTYNNKPYDLKYIHFKAFHTNTSSESNIYNSYNENNVLKAVFLPETLKLIGWQDNKTYVRADNTAFYSFNNCTALEYVEFHKDTALSDNTINRGAFTLCTSLKAISIPEGITTIGGGAFQNCSSLNAVYLPGTLTKINLDSSSFSFIGCNDMYFVNEPFVMNSVSRVPQKPDTYYLPSGLTTVPIFYENSNETVVIGSGVTSHSTSVYGGSGVKTVVYLGNVTALELKQVPSNGLNVILPNTTTEPTVTVPDSSVGGIYLCKLNTYKNFGESSWTEGTVHFVEQIRTVETAASCKDASKTTYCYCGELVESIVENGTGLGHQKDGAQIIGIAYTSFDKDGIKTYFCQRCEENVQESALPLFTCLGYSAPENGNGGIAIGFTVNNEAIAEYEEVTGKTLKYGVFAVLQSRLGDNDVFAEDGTVAEGAINADITSYEFALFELKIVGFTDEYKDIKLAMGAYVAVTDGETTKHSYLQSGTPNENEKYCFVSFNDIIGKQPANAEVVQ